MAYLDDNGLLYFWQKIKTKLSNKVDKESGKGLSTNDYTTDEKTKLAGLKNYTLPTASANTLGGVKVGTNLSISDGVLSAKDTTYSDMTGATTSAAGTHGLAPAPEKGAANRYLRSDGSWVVPPDTNTTYSDATQSSHGLMSTADKTKLDGIATGANNYVHPTGSGNKHIPAGGSSGQILRWSADGTAVWGADNNTTYNDFSGTDGTNAGAHGLVPAPSKLDGQHVLIGAGGWADLKLDGKTGANGYQITLSVGGAEVTGAGILHASTLSSGVMSPAMYTKLYDLPTASTLSDTYAKKSDIAGMYQFKGSVSDASKLPTSGQKSGDVYSIETDSIYGAAGMNVAWTSDGKWDNLGGIFTITAITNAKIDEICA